MMQENYNDYKKVLTQFVSLCEQNNLWYSLANNTMLSAMTNTDYFANIGILEVFVTNETFMFLKDKYPNNVVDFTSSDAFYLSTPFFFIQDVKKFIKIILLVPSSVEKVNKVFVLKNKIKYNFSNLLTFKKGHNASSRLIFAGLKITSPLWCPIEQNKLYDSLYHENYRGFIAINSLSEPTYKNWFPNITFKMEEVELLHIKVKVIKEYNNFLISRYGDDWKNGVDIKHSHFDYEKIKV